MHVMTLHCWCMLLLHCLVSIYVTYRLSVSRTTMCCRRCAVLFKVTIQSLGNVSVRGSSAGAAVSDNNVERGGYKGWFSRMMKWSCLLAITESLSDNSIPSVDINGADMVMCFCLSWRNLTSASFISPCSRRASAEDAVCSAHCCLKTQPLWYSSESPLCIAFFCWLIIEKVTADIQDFSAYKSGVWSTYRAAKSSIFQEHSCTLPTGLQWIVILMGNQKLRGSCSKFVACIVMSSERSERLGTKCLFEAGVDLPRFNNFCCQHRKDVDD